MNAKELEDYLKQEREKMDRLLEAERLTWQPWPEMEPLPEVENWQPWEELGDWQFPESEDWQILDDWQFPELGE